MPAPNKTPSHLTLFFKSARTVQKEHLASPKPKAFDLEIVERIAAGTEARVTFSAACDLILADVCIEVKPANKELIETAKQEIETRVKFVKGEKERSRAALENVHKKAA